MKKNLDFFGHALEFDDEQIGYFLERYMMCTNANARHMVADQAGRFLNQNDFDKFLRVAAWHISNLYSCAKRQENAIADLLKKG